MKSASAVSCSSCSYCDATSVKGQPYLVLCLGTGRLIFGIITLRESSQTRIRALREQLGCFAYPIALLIAFGFRGVCANCQMDKTTLKKKSHRLKSRGRHGLFLRSVLRERNWIRIGRS